ncbi:S-layer homology domain-containing protein [Candidatus Gracilibacteria bacterium]|nr:S-layer homology domain-containing protein [Candidatus Gracilibacteria bacterium]
MKKILSATLILSSLFTFGVSGYSSDMLDAANSLAERGIINDKSNNPSAYSLDSAVLRQEISAVARGVAGLPKKTSCDNIFSDVSATNPNTWVCYNVEVLVDNDLISANTNFRPEDNITKAESLGMLIKAIGFDYEYNPSSSKSWQEQIVDFAVEKGVVEKFSDYNTDASRGWVFEVANTTIEIQEEEEEKIEEMKKTGTYTDESL